MENDKPLAPGRVEAIMEKAADGLTPGQLDSIAQKIGFSNYHMFQQIHPDREILEYSFEHSYFTKYSPPQPPQARSYSIDGRIAVFVEDYVQWLYWKRVLTPPKNIKQIVRLIQERKIEGFKDKRVMRPSIGWMLFLDSARKHFGY